MRIDVLDSTKKKDFLEEVSYLGKFKLPYLFLGTGSETIRTYSGHLSVDEILRIWRAFPIEGVGLYFGKKIIDKHGRKESRLSLDALHLLKDKISGNVIELDEEQAQKWFRGNNIELTAEQKAHAGVSPDGQKKCTGMVGNFVAVKFKNDLIGTGKLSEAGILLSFLPKERRIRS
jgi:NOL1/NOP2/fmu family ribosome biogenesis protein